MGIGLHPQHFLKGWRLERAVRQLCHVQKSRLSVNNQSSMPCGQWCWRSGCVLAYQDQCFRVRLPTKTSCPFCSLRHLLWTSGFSFVSFLSLSLSSLLLQIASAIPKTYFFLLSRTLNLYTVSQQMVLLSLFTILSPSETGASWRVKYPQC